MKGTKRTIILAVGSIVLNVLPGYTAYSQIHTQDYPENKTLVTAEDQYLHGNYSVAIQAAKTYLGNNKQYIQSEYNNQSEKARYIIASSYLKLQLTGCEDSAKQFLSVVSDPVYKQRIANSLGQYYFRNNKLSEAISYYEMSGIANLSNSEISDQKFELAYCYFNNKAFDKAEPLFASIKDLDNSSYYPAANYYYGLLAYNENKYQEALSSFDRIREKGTYRKIVPYYIAEIYYFSGNRKKALEEAKSLLAQPEKLFYDNELHLLAAQCLFEDEQYANALPYYEYYYEHTDKIRKEDLYEMGFSYYKTDAWSNAIEKFKLLSNTRDSLAQTAMYLLGDCYLKTDDKQSARNAFAICAEMPYNPQQQEAALMLNAKLCYEMGYNDDALQQLNYLLQYFPHSSYKDEAKTLSSDLLIRTYNYKDAYEQLMDVHNKQAEYWRVYQKVTYGYAMQQLQNGNMLQADSLLSASLTQPKEQAYTAASDFWKGELAYRFGNYKDAVMYSQKFINEKNKAAQTLSPAATPSHALLTIGFASMKLSDYKTAQNYFNLVQKEGDEDSSMIMVAKVREADAYFMQKNYPQAIALYDKIITANGPDADYALFQKSILAGLQGKINDKAILLQSLIGKKPVSKYASGARYELGLTYIESNKYQLAINTLLPLTESFDARNLATKAWLKIGFAYQQLNNSDKAIEAYKRIVTEYPNAEERSAALDALKNLYIEEGQPALYTQILRENNLPSSDSSAIDSTYYATGESQYIASKWDKAKQAFTQYLSQFPKGIFIIKAHFYRAESNYHLNNMKDALTDYSTVLKYTWNEFSEASAIKAADISFQLKDYAGAGNYYQMLRNSAMGEDNLLNAYEGLMKTSAANKKYESAAAYADTILSLPSVDETKQNEASLIKANSLLFKAMLKNSTDSAAALRNIAAGIYKPLENAKDGAIAAEARYHSAEILFDNNNLKDAEKAASENIRLSAGNDYWIVKSYILLADILTAEKDYFNAKATLQSVVKHTKFPELKEIALKDLEHVKHLEKQHSKLSEE